MGKKNNPNVNKAMGTPAEVTTVDGNAQQTDNSAPAAVTTVDATAQQTGSSAPAAVAAVDTTTSQADNSTPVAVAALGDTTPKEDGTIHSASASESDEEEEENNTAQAASAPAPVASDPANQTAADTTAINAAIAAAATSTKQKNPRRAKKGQDQTGSEAAPAPAASTPAPAASAPAPVVVKDDFADVDMVSTTSSSTPSPVQAPAAPTTTPAVNLMLESAKKLKTPYQIVGAILQMRENYLVSGKTGHEDVWDKLAKDLVHILASAGYNYIEGQDQAKDLELIKKLYTTIANTTQEMHTKAAAGLMAHYSAKVYKPAKNARTAGALTAIADGVYAGCKLAENGVTQIALPVCAKKGDIGFNPELPTPACVALVQSIVLRNALNIINTMYFQTRAVGGLLWGYGPKAPASEITAISGAATAFANALKHLEMIERDPHNTTVISIKTPDDVTASIGMNDKGEDVYKWRPIPNTAVKLDGVTVTNLATIATVAVEGLMQSKTKELVITPTSYAGIMMAELHKAMDQIRAADKVPAPAPSASM
ncbi:MAG: hypothetical protein AB7F64_05200 [Gammaproteobacteria bacterium]